MQFCGALLDWTPKLLPSAKHILQSPDVSGSCRVAPRCAEAASRGCCAWNLRSEESALLRDPVSIQAKAITARDSCLQGKPKALLSKTSNPQPSDPNLLKTLPRDSSSSKHRSTLRGLGAFETLGATSGAFQRKVLTGFFLVLQKGLFRNSKTH